MPKVFRTPWKVVATVMGLAMQLTSCSSEAEDATSRPAEATATVDSQTVAVGPDTVRVILDEYVIGIPATLPAGPTVLRLESVGFEEHNLMFVFNPTDSLVWETEKRLAPYETRTVTVDLAPGAYTVVCDFSGHEGRGMVADLIVQPE